VFGAKEVAEKRGMKDGRIISPHGRGAYSFLGFRRKRPGTRNERNDWPEIGNDREKVAF